LLGLIAARLAKVPSVATVHLHDLSTYALRLYRLLDLVTLRFFPKVITVAESLRQELIGAGLPADKLVTIHNAIDAQAFASQAEADNHRLREQLGIEDQQPIVSTVGRLSPQKRHQDFLEAARRTLAVLPGAHFLVIGDGPERGDLEALAASLGIDSAVSFLGHRQDVAAWMAISDVIVMASIREGLPYVLLEALALAKPVVATCVGGVPELIRDGETGLLVPTQQPARMAEAILYVLSHGEEAARLGEKGRELVWQKFSPQSMAHKTAEVYREVLSGGQGSSR
ncbi:MAG: glycosyltransferase family 4 protein, partial [Chloroflexi bacterium]|nr:glycosyltransferase family 4 protein [Chloroflexota bacterium]